MANEEEQRHQQRQQAADLIGQIAFQILLGIVLALLVTPLFAALGLATLTAPFILAGWLIRAGIQMLGKAAVDATPCAQGDNQPRLR